MKLHHICIQTKNYPESLDFYTRILGFSLVKETRDFHGRAYNTWLVLDDFYIELQTAKAGQELRDWTNLGSGPVHLAFMVEDVDREYERIRGLGYKNFKLKNSQEVYQVLGSKLFKLRAPEGTEVEIRDKNI